MKGLILLAASALVLTPCIMEAQDALDVVMRDGGETFIEKMSVSEICLGTENVEIKLSNGETLSFPRMDVLQILFSVSAGTEVANVDEKYGTVSREGDYLVIKDMPEGTHYGLFDMAGRCLVSDKYTPPRSCVSLAPYQSGVYLLVTDGHIYKTVK